MATAGGGAGPPQVPSPAAGWFAAPRSARGDLLRETRPDPLGRGAWITAGAHRRERRIVIEPARVPQYRDFAAIAAEAQRPAEPGKLSRAVVRRLFLEGGEDA